MKKIVVTGGAGFIGSHLVELLINKNFSVRIIDDLRFGHKKFIDKRAEFFRVSLANLKKVEKIIAGADAVMHLAASSIIKGSYENPSEYFENNLINGIKLLDAMRRKSIKKIIFSSTSSVYGEPVKTPVSEEDPTHPLNAYAASKLSFEHALVSYYHSFGIQSVTLRYYNVYGPRDEQKPLSRAIPTWVDAILQNKSVPWYWQGKQIRDYVYVTDIAQAHLDVLKLKGLHCFNVGSGKGVYMREVLWALESVIGHKVHTKDLGERKGDPMKSYADITRIQKSIGWSPTVSLLEGLKRTYEYYKYK